MKMPKFNKEKVKEVAITVGLAAAFFSMPVLYQMSKERQIEKFLVDHGCADLGEPNEANPAQKILKKGYACNGSVIGGPPNGINIVPIYK